MTKKNYIQILICIIIFVSNLLLTNITSYLIRNHFSCFVVVFILINVSYFSIMLLFKKLKLTNKFFYFLIAVFILSPLLLEILLILNTNDIFHILLITKADVLISAVTALIQITFIFIFSLVLNFKIKIT